MATIEVLQSLASLRCSQSLFVLSCLSSAATSIPSSSRSLLAAPLAIMHVFAFITLVSIAFASNCGPLYRNRICARDECCAYHTNTIRCRIANIEYRQPVWMGMSKIMLEDSMRQHLDPSPVTRQTRLIFASSAVLPLTTVVQHPAYTASPDLLRSARSPI
jgi:hypothetical protein